MDGRITLNEKPRVVIVGPLPPPVGGVETYTSIMLNSDIKERFDILHCNTTKGRPKQTQGKFDLGNIIWAFRHFKRLKDSIKKHQPALVYMPISSTRSGFMRDSVLIRIVKKARRLLVGHVHGGDFDNLYNSANTAQKKHIVSVLNMCDMLVLLGSLWETFLREAGVTKPIRIAPATIREELYEAGIRVVRNYEQPERVVVLFVGQIGKRKGVFDILEAASDVHDAYPNVFFEMVGPEEFQGELEKVMARFRLNSADSYVHFSGSKSGQELLKAYTDAHLFILPSYFEGQPAVLLEAGAFGLPVITTPVGAIPDLVEDGVNGFLVEPGDVKTLAERIKFLVAHPDRRCAMGEENRKRIEDFHPHRVATKVGNAIEETIKLGSNTK